MGYQRYRKQASELGADVVIVEEVQTARAMQEAVIEHLAGCVDHDV